MNPIIRGKVIPINIHHGRMEMEIIRAEKKRYSNE